MNKVLRNLLKTRKIPQYGFFSSQSSIQNGRLFVYSDYRGNKKYVTSVSRNKSTRHYKDEIYVGRVYNYLGTIVLFTK